MTISVTMLQTRMGEDGELWTVEGSPYGASLDFAYYLIGNNFATGTLPTSVQSYPMTQVVATAAEIAAIAGQPGVRYVERDGDKREFRWVDGFMVQVGTGGGDGGDGLSPGTYGDIIATGIPTTGLNISGSVLTTAARTVVDDATVAAMVNTLGGATSTGSGGLVRATSPTLVTPILGTPTSINLSNGTSLPVSTGISGLGTGVAAFLATPSSANLRTALTDETGTGAAVFATSPTLVTPILGTPTSGTLTNCTGLPAAGVTGLTTVATDAIFDAAGDMVVGTGANTAARLAIGATGNVLRSTGSTAYWSALTDLAAEIADLLPTAPTTQTFYFAAAGTYIVAAGPCTAYSIFLTTSVTGTVRIYDNVAASGPDVLGSTVTAAGSNIPIRIGTPPTYGAANTGLTLVVTGTNVGYVTYGE